MLSKADVLRDPVLSTAISDEFRMFTWSSKDKRILVYPVDFDRQLNVTCTHPAHLSDKETASGDSEAAIGPAPVLTHDT